MGASLDALDPELRGAAVEFVQWLGGQGVQPRVTSTLRSRSEQNRLYRRYLQGISSFPALPAGYSAHEYGWAFDLVVSPYDYQEAVGAAWLEIGGSWGGRRDPVHFELPGASAAAAELGAAADAQGSFWDRAVVQAGRQSSAAKAIEEAPWWQQLFVPWWLSAAPAPVTYTQKP